MQLGPGPTTGMRLRRLSLRGFRNLEDADLELPAEGVAIVGPNAQGKTNLLEAVHYLETFRSFRGARDEQLVRIGGEVFRLEGELEVGESRAQPPGVREVGSPPRGRGVTAAYDARVREKRVTLDGQVPERLADAIGAVGSILFTPDDARLVSEGPAERRRFLDVLLSLNDAAYLRSLQRFRQTLARRNAALRRGEGPAAVSAWDAGLVRAGSEVTLARARWVTAHAAGFSDYCREISGRGAAFLRYEPSVTEAEAIAASATPSDPAAATSALDAVADSYGAALDRSREQERRLRTTVVGPHRDEVRFTLEAPEGGRDARELGSGGERRTVALALRLLEADTLRERRGREPILLVDDLFAELDEDRARRVLDLLDRLAPGQVILTAPEESDVRFRSATLSRWRIGEGRVDAS